MGYLYESWCSAQEDWRQSTVYMTISSKNGTVKRGIKKWMTRTQMEASVGKEVAAAIIDYKLSNETLRQTEVRANPDAPNNEARSLTTSFEVPHALSSP